MTSPNGVTWTARSSAADNSWNSVTYGNGLFVAVAGSGTGNRVMTSPNGITWTIRSTPVDNGWFAVTYGSGLFVAVANSGTGNRVMTSPDGINWTIRSSPADNNWFSVTYGNGLFVAVAYSGTGNRVMTSADGITWMSRSSAADNDWRSVTYANGLFVAVASTGTGNRVMTSPDGITWTIRNSPADNTWVSVTYGNSLFVAVSITGSGNRVMTSPNGATWTIRSTPVDNQWFSVIYRSGVFVAVAQTGTGNRAMTSGSFVLPVDWLSINGNLNSSTQATISWKVAEQNVVRYEIEKSNDAISFSTIVTIAGKGDGTNDYTFSETQALTGTSYYRVKQIDIDGRSSYSSIITLRNKNQHPISIYPNPAKELVTVTVGNDLLNKNAVLTDMNGKVLQRIKISSLSFAINMGAYASGVYLIKIDNNNQIKIVKE
jgi:hypothetical protein